MLRIYINVIVAAALLPLLASCFGDDPANAECDIERVAVSTGNAALFFPIAADSAKDVGSTTSEIVFYYRDLIDSTAAQQQWQQHKLRGLAPELTTTPGATVQPASGSAHDFSGGRRVAYHVVSQDGSWARDYTIRFELDPQVEDTLHFDFENTTMETKENSSYYQWYEANPTLTWATANEGFWIARHTTVKDPAGYPTAPLEEGLNGRAIRLTTCDTGAFGNMVGRRLAAGNLFLGTLDTNLLLTQTLMSTRMGVPFNRKPVKFTGYYRYHPGQLFQHTDGSKDPAITDEASIYAVFYRNHSEDGGEPIVLFGDNCMNSPDIVALARLRNIKTTSEWTPFELDFPYEGVEVDPDIMAAKGYSLTLVFSSSKDGAFYEGAPGSVLDIDQVTVVCEKVRKAETANQ